MHKHFVKPGRLSKETGRKYDDLMNARVEADYQAIIRCTAKDAENAVEDAESVVAAFKRLLEEAGMS